jgi:hypothetical protein
VRDSLPAMNIIVAENRLGYTLLLNMARAFA